MFGFLNSGDAQLLETMISVVDPNNTGFVPTDFLRELMYSAMSE
jgi:hypothetical protein